MLATSQACHRKISKSLHSWTTSFRPSTLDKTCIIIFDCRPICARMSRLSTFGFRVIARQEPFGKGETNYDSLSGPVKWRPRRGRLLLGRASSQSSEIYNYQGREGFAGRRVQALNKGRNTSGASCQRDLDFHLTSNHLIAELSPSRRSRGPLGDLYWRPSRFRTVPAYES